MQPRGYNKQDNNNSQILNRESNQPKSLNSTLNNPTNLNGRTLNQRKGLKTLMF